MNKKIRDKSVKLTRKQQELFINDFIIFESKFNPLGLVGHYIVYCELFAGGNTWNTTVYLNNQTDDIHKVLYKPHIGLEKFKYFKTFGDAEKATKLFIQKYRIGRGTTTDRPFSEYLESCRNEINTDFIDVFLKYSKTC